MEAEAAEDLLPALAAEWLAAFDAASRPVARPLAASAAAAARSVERPVLRAADWSPIAHVRSC
jgi:hypothetical protein